MSEPKNNKWLWIAGIGIAAAVIIYALGRFFRITVEVVRTFEPSEKDKKEIEHRKSLAKYLREKMPGHCVVEEYGTERSRADIVIGNNPNGLESSTEMIVIELKLELRAKSEVDRVVGQCMHYKQSGFEKVLLYLIDPEANMLEVLKSRLQIQPLLGFASIIEANKNEPNVAMETIPEAVTDPANTGSAPSTSMLHL
jgi:hypothetical protein